MWTVTHASPDGITRRSHYPEWNAATNWLRCMMQTYRPEALVKLRAATPDAKFCSEVSGHSFSLDIDAVRADA